MEDFEREIQIKALNTLLENGMTFDVPNRSIFKYFLKKKQRTFTITQSYLGTLDYLYDLYLQIDIDDNKIKKDGILEARKLFRHASKMAKIVAYAVINSGDKSWLTKIRLALLQRLFLKSIHPKKLHEICYVINVLNNASDFTHSIRLMSVAQTTAIKANLVEEDPQV